MSGVYYNENDPFCAAVLRRFIVDGHIADGDVDERDIRDVHPDDLRGYAQHHFFAGLGTWSYALRLAGWPDDRSVWTGSCPCQPFSAAGKGAGFDDERHLWPFWYWLIAQCGPADILGEQVASKDVEPWLDLVFTDLEAARYACGAIPFPSASVRAPHLRDRTFFVAHADLARSQGRRRVRERIAEFAARASRLAGALAHDHDHGRGAQAVAGLRDAEHHVESRGGAGLVADTDVGVGGEGRPIDGGRDSRSDAIARTRPSGDGMSGELADADVEHGDDGRRRASNVVELGASAVSGREHGLSDASPLDGFWATADWILCRDGKWRPVEPGTQPLAHGLPVSMGKLDPGLHRLAEMAGLSAASLKRAKSYRTGSLRAYGNTINPWQAAEFIRAACEAIEVAA